MARSVCPPFLRKFGFRFKEMISDVIYVARLPESTGDTCQGYGELFPCNKETAVSPATVQISEKSKTNV
jgi:hypothetical protein